MSSFSPTSAPGMRTQYPSSFPAGSRQTLVSPSLVGFAPGALGQQFQRQPSMFPAQSNPPVFAQQQASTTQGSNWIKWAMLLAAAAAGIGAAYYFLKPGNKAQDAVHAAEEAAEELEPEKVLDDVEEAAAEKKAAITDTSKAAVEAAAIKTHSQHSQTPEVVKNETVKEETTPSKAATQKKPAIVEEVDKAITKGDAVATDLAETVKTEAKAATEKASRTWGQFAKGATKKVPLTAIALGAGALAVNRMFPGMLSRELGLHNLPWLVNALPKAVGSRLTSALPWLENGVCDTTQPMYSSALMATAGAVPMVKGAFNDAIHSVNGTAIMETISNKGSQVANGFASGYNATVEGLGNALGTVGNFTSTNVQAFRDGASSVIGSTYNKTMETLPGLRDYAGNKTMDAVNMGAYALEYGKNQTGTLVKNSEGVMDPFKKAGGNVIQTGLDNAKYYGELAGNKTAPALAAAQNKFSNLRASSSNITIPGWATISNTFGTVKNYFLPAANKTVG